MQLTANTRQKRAYVRLLHRDGKVIVFTAREEVNGIRCLFGTNALPIESRKNSLKHRLPLLEILSELHIFGSGNLRPKVRDGALERPCQNLLLFRFQ